MTDMDKFDFSVSPKTEVFARSYPKKTFSYVRYLGPGGEFEIDEFLLKRNITYKITDAQAEDMKIRGKRRLDIWESDKEVSDASELKKSVVGAPVSTPTFAEVATANKLNSK